MKFARRMILVPEEEYQALKSGENSDKVQRLKPAQMRQQQLQKPFTQLTQNLGKLIRQRNQVKAKEVDLKTPIDFNREVLDMTEHLPQTSHHKARLLILELRKQGFAWGDSNELITPGGQTLHGSNVIDLITEALVAQTKKRLSKPKGWGDFISSVARSGIPKTMFTKKSTRKALESSLEEQQVQSSYHTPFRTPPRLGSTTTTPYRAPHLSGSQLTPQVINWDGY